MKGYVWKQRDAEWIKNNPGKGTMYKESADKEITVELLPAKEAKVSPIHSLFRPNNFKIGIYIILCETERSVYVGQSRNMEGRLKHHKSTIKAGKKSRNNVYTRMIEHKEKHGLKAFEFLQYWEMDSPSSDELLRCEDKTMIKYLNEGYSLYNYSVCSEISSNSVYCNPSIKPQITQLINLVKEKPEIMNKIEELIRGSV